MDVNAIRAKLDSLQKKPKKKFEKIDKEKVFWKPKVGKQTIRIVPSKFNPSFPFKEVFVHYGINKYPMLALTNFDEKDPIVEFVQEAKKQTLSKEDYKMVSKMEPKMRVFAQVLVRGEEELGVRLWEFGKEVYNELLSLANDEDIGDYTSITDGRDFTVETVGPEVTGTKYNKSSIRAKTKTSPLTEDSVLLKTYLEEQKDVLSLYSKMEYNDMKDVLQNYLSPKDEEGAVDEEEEEEAVSSAPLEKVTKSTKFDDLFEK